VYVFGDTQGVIPLASRVQTKVEPASLLVKAKVADALSLEAGGLAVSVVFGATVSTVHVYFVVGPVVAATARTENVCAPSARPVYTTGLVLLHGENPASSAHSNRADLFDVKLKLAVFWFVTVGGSSVRVTTGSTVSIVH
jgi:hypothetical protein